MKIVDLSKTIVDNPVAPGFLRVKIKPKSRRFARFMVRMLGLPYRLMPDDFEGWADDTIRKLGVHATTHIDAPVHYGSVSEGEPAATIEQLPLEACIGPGVVLDMSQKEEGDPINVADIEAELARTGARIEQGTITLIRTDRDKFSDDPEFWKYGTGMSAEATEWLIDRGSRVMGIDQWGWDLPFHMQIARAKAENRKDLFWEAHRVGIRRTYWHMEQLTNLDKLPPSGFTVHVMPLKLKGASAAPARVIAILDAS
ncbi:cyclase family protein [Marinibacterium profundimaris]|uniref:Cyclase n=1 Tax=Marinibacterium profundimaris TaxID=1679460 RepID=A0A225NFL4_9RHOB|nr:cyclase family protein [Marinibacterium profundimaris]OWU71755.1 cyclase [Marinibacterium profundimaris]